MKKCLLELNTAAAEIEEDGDHQKLDGCHSMFGDDDQLRLAEPHNFYQECQTPTLQMSQEVETESHDILIKKMVEELKKNKLLELHQVVVNKGNTKQLGMETHLKVETNPGNRPQQTREFEDLKKRKLDELKKKLVVGNSNGNEKVISSIIQDGPQSVVSPKESSVRSTGGGRKNTEPKVGSVNSKKAYSITESGLTNTSHKG